MFEVPPFVLHALEWMSTLFVLVVGTGLLAVAGMYVYDKYQTTNSVRRNYPVVGRFRSFFTHLGEFFRQYFFAMDREELPFNRAQRNWAERAAKDMNNTAAFGSTKNLWPEGTVMFANCLFPQLDEEMSPPSEILFRCSPAFSHLLVFQYLGDELWLIVQTGGQGIVQRRKNGGYLAEYG